MEGEQVERCPILLREICREEEKLLRRFEREIKGIKQKLSSARIVACTAVAGYDLFATIVSGVDVSCPHVPRAVLGLAADPDFRDGALSVPAQSR
jgi:hypothetical protein